MVIRRDFPYYGSNRPLHIYLPDTYDQSDERYPVMYFFDGHNLYFDSDATYGKSWGLKTFLDSWEKEMIVVGMECSHVGNERLEEYLPYPATTTAFGPLAVKGNETLHWRFKIEPASLTIVTLTEGYAVIETLNSKENQV